MGLVQAANELAYLRIGSFPTWTSIAQVTDATEPGAPTTAGDGVALNGAVVALVAVRPRATSAYRSFTYEVTAYDAATTYEIGIPSGPTTVSTSAAGSAALTAAALKTAIEGNGTLNALWTVTVDGATLTIVGKASDDYAISAGVSSGTGTIEVIADASSAKARIWLSEGGDPSTRNTAAWDPPETQPFATAVDCYGSTERVDVAGHTQVYVQLYDLAGHASDVGVDNVTAQGRIGVCGLPSSLTT